MKQLFTILSLILWVSLHAQTEQEKLAKTIREFHQAMVDKNIVSLNQQTDKALSYGHSNGWIENKAEFLKDIETKYIDYHSIKEDSLVVTINGSLAHARFICDINGTLHAANSNFHLRVLEVWVKKGKRWLLFARQATR